GAYRAAPFWGLPGLPWSLSFKTRGDLAVPEHPAAARSHKPQTLGAHFGNEEPRSGPLQHPPALEVRSVTGITQNPKATRTPGPMQKFSRGTPARDGAEESALRSAAPSRYL